MCAQLNAVRPDDPEQRRAFVIRRAERREHVGDAARDWRPNRERVPRSRTAAASKRFVSLRQPRFSRTKPGLRGGHRALRILNAASRHSPVGEQPLGACLFCACTVERNPRLRDLAGQRGMILRIGQPGFEPSERLTSADVRSD